MRRKLAGAGLRIKNEGLGGERCRIQVRGLGVSAQGFGIGIGGFGLMFGASGVCGTNGPPLALLGMYGVCSASCASQYRLPKVGL